MEFQFNKILKNYILLLALTFGIIGVFIYILFMLSTKYYSIILILMLVSSSIILVGTVINLGLISKGYKDRFIPYQLHFLTKSFMSLTFPLLNLLTKVFKINKQEIRKFYIEINNILVNSIKYKIKPNQILVLTPHCLQDSNCQVKVTNNPLNCKRCGKCNVKELVELKEKYGVEFYIASGGTFARKIVGELNPQYIISIACERDLLSGIQDVKGIPVMGIQNERPNGPCLNTKIDVRKVEEAMLNIIDK